MKGNPEDAVIAEINALEADDLIDSQLAAGETRPGSVPACRCGAPWHGLPRNGCPGSHAAGERELSEEPAGEVYVDEHYELRASHGLMQIIPSNFAVNPPPVDREFFLRQFNDAVHQMVEETARRAEASDSMVIVTRYDDSPMDQLLAVDDGRTSRFRLFPQQAQSMGSTETDQRRDSWQQRLRRLFRSDSR
ncbi:Uncharacterised protein [Mycobacteroides abscessus subsp. abscessus]|uniref:hypothetical protein n=1 Tax=Mycobacteroides abscessus TaxID=36809 RepID=UPI00092C76CD|nr:hypothetical protein [Mycobacteroides abscessus]SIM06630.1 Uncharacterised protein [Mycobacteroides abscessus subsp. abscessus]SLC77064.1 Uncharacterised protein [Mycobacteroides abscessus subsp. abscessus]